jgi:hypothetical protein
MTTQIKRRRGTTTQHSSFTGAEGELTIDTTKDTVVVHDGSTAGGHPLAKESALTGKLDKAGGTMTGALDVQSTITSDGLTVDGNFQLNGDVTITDTSGDPFLKLETGQQSYVLRIDNDASDIFQVRDVTNSANRLSIAGTGDISFYDGSNNAKFFWDASAERLGIGVTDPDAGIEVQKSSTGVNSVHFANTSSTGYGAKFIGGGNTSTRYIADFRDYSGTSKLRLDGNGNVGIGVTPPAWSGIGPALTVGNASTASYSTGSLHFSYLYNNLYYNGTSEVYKATGKGSLFQMAEDQFRWFSAPSGTGGNTATLTEVMRIDGGNLLVGKTSSGIGTAGFQANPTGDTYNTVSGNITAYYNRLSSDGDIVQFRKDGTTVGSIASRAGAVLSIVLDPRSGQGAGITGGGKTITPTNESGANVDADIDLGQSVNRFKDLYLSGGVYLGGTGSDNKLDSYEQGTWTITDGSGAGLSFTVQDNVYTKAGRLVVASAIITWPSTSDTRAARIVLPFTSIANNSHSGGVVTEQNWDTSITLTASCNYTDGVIFRQRGAGSLTNANLSGKKLRFTVTYHAA